ncbi:phage tail protein [Ligilactobacillus sp. WILCCON 0076]|uniref:Phage tail protein n=1 Tax=Ligilactobacillus ubinensis TaxID=2876789 RepID=A0A9X2FJZ7_9LACO|nr:phage tail protein [Ligilactobacillus ubinensis]MCP0885923.1 phage tail protein [Ligilactobacillus ubinensis]
MTLFYDKDGNGFIARTTFTREIDTSGNISISGTIFEGDDVLQNVGYGWSFKFQDEKYVISYTKLNDEDNTVEFDAVHKFLWDFSKSMFYETWNGSHTFVAYLNALFDDSGYTYDLQTTVAAFEKENWGMKSKADLLSDIIDQADVELSISGTKVTIKESIGADLTSIARYGVNLSDLIEENSISDFATHGKGFGEYYDENDTSKGRLTVEYTSDLATTYGILDVEPIADEKYSIAANLLAAVKKKVDATFAVSLSLNMYDLENAGYPNYDSPEVGDWILAIDEKLNFKRKVRIVKLKEEFNANEKRIGYTVTAGDLSQAEQLQSVQSSTASAIQQLQSDVITVYYAANGKNRTFTGTDDPNTLSLTDLIANDIYWRTNGNYKELWIYDGTRWNQEISDATGVEISKNVATAMADSDKATQDANTAVSGASSALAKAQTSIDTANTASDTATAVQEQVTTLKGGSTITLAELENGLATKISSDEFTSYKTQTDNALINKVSSTDFASYQTQTDSAIQQRITTTNAQALVTTTANEWSANLSALQDQVNNSAVGTNLAVGTSNVLATGSYGTWGQSNTVLQTTGMTLTSGTTYTARVYVTGCDIDTNLCIRVYNGSSQLKIYAGNKVSANTSGYSTVTFTATDNVTGNQVYGTVSYTASQSASHTISWKEFKLEKGSVATDWCLAPSEQATTVALTAVNTALTSAINLRVQKNDVINQINISTESILIGGSKVHITGSTTIDDAIITSAMIDSLSASKLTAGTIDASQITVLNLDASSIVSGTLTGIRIMQTGTAFNATISGGTISIQNSAGTFLAKFGPSLDSNYVPNGAYIVNGEGQIFSINQGNSDGSKSMALVQVPSDSTFDSPHVNIYNARIGFSGSQTFIGNWFTNPNSQNAIVGNGGVALMAASDNAWTSNSGTILINAKPGSVDINVAMYPKQLVAISGRTYALGGITMRNNQAILVDTGNLWVQTESTDPANVHALSFINSSLLSLKKVSTALTKDKAREAIKSVDIMEYQYISEIERGDTKVYATPIIDDVNDKPEYTIPYDWMSADGTGRDDGTAIGYTIVAVQDLYDKIDDLQSQITKLKGAA